MSLCKWCSVLLFALVIGSCGKSLPALDGINLTDWKNDKNACAGKRTAMAGEIEAQKGKLLSLSETQIITLLGKPDQNELLKRNQKYYYYFVEASTACDSSNGEHQMRLAIRFNAMGLAKEISLEK